MSFATQKNNRFNDTFVPISSDVISLKEEDRSKTSLYCRASRYVNERMIRQRNYKTVLVSVKPVQPIQDLTDAVDGQSFFVKLHVPQNHSLNRTNFSFTLEDLSHRLGAMKLKYPLCVYCHENDPCARLNYQQSMEGNLDGKDYLTLLFVARSEIKAYKKRWPNQILVELPFDNVPENWKDLYRQSIKVFAETIGVNYTYLLEDNIYYVLKQNENGFSQASLFEYLTTLQEAANQSNAPILGSRIAQLGSEGSLARGDSTWANAIVQGCVLLKTQNNPLYFSKTSSTTNDSGLVEYQVRANDAGLVQQNQQFVIVCGYSLDDPIAEKKRPNFYSLSKIEPENNGLNFRVKVLENEKLVDERLSDGTRWARSLAVIADDTAAAVFIAINEQIEQLEVGKNYLILNAKVVMYKGYMRLEIDEWGNIVPLNEEVQTNTKKNVSCVEYELVDSEK